MLMFRVTGVGKERSGYCTYIVAINDGTGILSSYSTNSHTMHTGHKYPRRIIAVSDRAGINANKASGSIPEVRTI